LAHYLYFSDAKDPNNFRYLKIARRQKFDGYPFFLNAFTELNEMMSDKTNQKYPKPILEQLASLQARMSSLDPDERPSAIEILEQLQDIALADWKA
jgi:serine/threonine protein kinase